MVCQRCILAVNEELKKLKLKPEKVSLGEVRLVHTPSKEQLTEFENRLNLLGFELLDNLKHKLIEKVKSLLIQRIQNSEIEEHFSLSEYLGQAVYDEKNTRSIERKPGEAADKYSNLSRLFSSVESMTIEQFFILQKIEKVKEWLAYDEWTLSEMAWKLGYSSVAHLSSQFKKTTGLTPSQFKKWGGHRTPLDKV